MILQGRAGLPGETEELKPGIVICWTETRKEEAESASCASTRSTGSAKSSRTLRVSDSPGGPDATRHATTSATTSARHSKNVSSSKDSA